MIDKSFYYFELFITLCGYNGTDGSSLSGFALIVTSVIIVVYSFYFAVTRIIWPDTADGYPVKHAILDDSAGDFDAD